MARTFKRLALEFNFNKNKLLQKSKECYQESIRLNPDLTEVISELKQVEAAMAADDIYS